MPDILLEVMARTGFARSFTHLSERHAKVEHFDIRTPPETYVGQMPVCEI